MRYERTLGLGGDPVLQMKVVNCFRSICNNLITFENAFSLKNRIFLSKIEVKYVKDIIVAIYIVNLGVSRKEVIQVISDKVQAGYYLQADNYYYF